MAPAIAAVPAGGGAPCALPRSLWGFTGGGDVTHLEATGGCCMLPKWSTVCSSCGLLIKRLVVCSSVGGGL